MTTEVSALPAAAWTTAGTRFTFHAAPVVAVLAIVVVGWYALAVWLNAPQVIDRFARDGGNWTVRQLVDATWSMERPVLPAPHQIARDFYQTVFATPIDSKRSLIYHAGVTVSATLLGFVLGAALGIALAIGIIHLPMLDRSLLPWIIASQTVPILAIAPMIVVVLGNLGFGGLLPKAIISMYLCFFPVTVGVVKGLRSPDPLQLDLMRTYSASRAQVFRKLRWPSATGFLFASLKVAIAASLIGAIVGELPTGAQAGLGARLLSGSYYGQTMQIWSALIMASLVGVVLVSMVAVAERLVMSRQGAA
ncbi:MAG: ABC transporter permease [Betaproteobacteria bacterium]|nr:ABC transporter permease [Betaproteobacteria bacterium]